MAPLTTLILLAPLLCTSFATANRSSAVWVAGHRNLTAQGAVVVSPTAAFTRDATARSFPLRYFRRVMEGRRFTVFMRVAPGSYRLTVGYRGVRPGCDEQRRNVFGVIANGLQLYSGAGFDISEACAAVRVDHFEGLVVPDAGAVAGLLAVRFVASVGNASVAFVKAERTCHPPATLDDFERDPHEDHLAHAVPGVVPPVTDRRKQRFVHVALDGGHSHTHFSTENGSGSIVAYEWRRVGASQPHVLSTAETFTHPFPIGTTKLKLTVVDSACSQHAAYTDVTVTENLQRGAYCYYYRATPTSEWPAPGSAALLDWPRPVYATVASKVATFKFDNRRSDRSFPFKTPLDNRYVVRCVFFADHSQIPQDTDSSSNATAHMTYEVATRLSGDVRLYRDDALLVDTESGNSSATVPFESGTASYELFYRVTDPARAAFAQLRVNGVVPRTLSHDQAAVLPILRSVDPSTASSLGGARVRLSGYGLYLPLKVRLGSTVSVEANKGGATATQVFVTVPKTAEVQALSGSVKVRVESDEKKVSNAQALEFFSVASSMCDDVKFEDTELKTTAGSSLEQLNQPTAVAIGSDMKLYVGTRGGRVQVVTYDRARLAVTSLCHSEVLSDERYKRANGRLSPRVILGVAFNPHDLVPRPYVSVSTLFWGRAKMVDPANPTRWANGGVERLMPATDEARARDQAQCLQRDAVVVSGLPVQDGDHSVNEMVFTQNGDLLIGVGGYTNSGLPGGKFGGAWESYFSAAVLIAKLSRGPRFNGTIPYITPDNHRTARPKPGYTDVALYATGVRNLFSMTMSRTGRIYAVDMGPNCGYGNVSVSCAEYNETEAARGKTWSVPGRVVVDWKARPRECRYGPGRQDKLLLVRRGKYYGHPNLQRGRPGECVWVDPKTDESPAKGVATPANYEAPLAMVPSAKTGVTEYKSALFCGGVRGDLIMAQNSGKGSWRVRMARSGAATAGKPFEFLNGGGIRVVENVHGDLMFPRYLKKLGNGVFVNRPVTSLRGRGLHVVNVHPWRHPRRGGTTMTVGGWGFNTNATQVFVGGSECAVLANSTTATEVQCTVPARPGNSSAKPFDVRVVVNGTEDKLEQAVLYMKV